MSKKRTRKPDMPFINVAWGLESQNGDEIAGLHPRYPLLVCLLSRDGADDVGMI